MKKIRIALVAGTRPEVIKMAPVYFALRASEILEPVLVSSGQHRQMLDQALGVFGIEADADLNLMQPGQTLPDLTARVITAMTGHLKEQRPDAVLVQGDTTTVFAAAIAAFYEGIPVGHVEAGLRTGNMRSPFPEEMNRKLTSPLARWHFCPTDQSRQNLLNEGIDPAAVHVTGNTVIDALFWMRDQMEASGVDSSEVIGRCGVPAPFAERFLGSQAGAAGLKFILVTGHRRESFGEGFENICRSISEITQRHPNVGILYPVHLNPRVQEPVNRLLGNNPRIALIPPVGYSDFVWFMNRCCFALSDSGGVQEEAPSLGKPVLVMRETTERPEGVEAGTCTLVGTDPEKILAEANRLLTDSEEYVRRSQLKNPYGDGSAAQRIVGILKTYWSR